MRILIAALLLAGCATIDDPLSDVSAMQRRLDDRGIGFGITRVPGHDAFVFQVRFQTQDTGNEVVTDPLAAAQAAAPAGCSVGTITTEDDGASYRVTYNC